ncbi:N-acetylmuramoyl-L-alanine amidase [Isoptericola sp. NEAU-Y5]|uniref:N-acetylmuramoyl-L-alanine amidase n=1 Tax=Isoptericola luteus TaxID=2879484 RepID=A0ABS7ZCD3_9MICO|nr:peptidoglycan recognition family protein [Isoptericola sp. NEAU-Y5]MCA5892711.1 N-acetylmuramoyl-L-alanine amidase [Isoptericola sp. NEAU-Y5]
MRSVRRRTTALAVAGLLVPLVATPALVAGAGPSSPPADGISCDDVVAAPDRQAAFAAASEATGVPADLLKAVSYLESRWDQHAGVPSTDGGYGVFNLLDHAPEAAPDGAGKGEPGREPVSEVARAAALTGLDEPRLKSDAGANICGGAALLAFYQEAAGLGTDADLEDWGAAVARMSDVPGFAERVYTTLRQGQERSTDDGGTVALAARPEVAALGARAGEDSDPATHCPRSLGCEWLPAPYEKGSPDLPDDTGNYGNHDQADRTGAGGPSIEYILIHDTETSYDGTVRLVQDPSYLAWNYTLRSSDGHVANHLEPADVGWHAGNWYVNMHSIGLEHEGWAGTAGWYTEALYQSSAELVRYLAHEHDVPLDRAHVIGHDQVPGILPGYTKNVHWDPGPYWDWDHYFELLGAPIGAGLDPTTDVQAGDVVEVVAGDDENTNPITGCEQASPGSGDCVEGADTNFVLAYSEPSLDAPYARDPGWKPDGAAGTTHASDISARVTSGHKFVVAQVTGDWLGVWWAGSLVWVHNPAERPVVVPATGKTVTVTGTQDASVYGRAYPEAAAYDPYPGIPVQPVTPIEYTIGADQTYVVSDDDVPADYYRAVTFDGSGPGDRTDVRGQDHYVQLWYAHRQVFARTAELTVHDPVVTDVEGPSIRGRAQIGKVLRADVGEYLPDSRHLRTRVQWLRDGEPVRGADGRRYHLTGRDRGAEISVAVTVSARGYESATFVSDPTAPVRPH